MKKLLRVGGFALMLTVLPLGSSTVPANPIGFPLPPGPVLCGCVCPDGSFTTTHAPSFDACPDACDNACSSGSF